MQTNKRTVLGLAVAAVLMLPIVMPTAALAQRGVMSNQDWWPERLDLSPLRQHDARSNPFGEDYDYTFHQLREKGFKNLLVNGEPFFLAQKRELDEGKDYQIELIIDRFTLKNDSYIQLAKSVEAAMLALDEDIMIKVEVLGDVTPSLEMTRYSMTKPSRVWFIRWPRKPEISAILASRGRAEAASRHGRR